MVGFHDVFYVPPLLSPSLSFSEIQLLDSLGISASGGKNLTLKEEEASDQGNRIRKRRKRAPIKGSWRRYSKGQSLVSGFFFLVSLFILWY